MIEFLLQHYGLVMLALTAGTLVVSLIRLFRMGGKPVHETPHLDPNVRPFPGKDTVSKAVTRFHKGERPNQSANVFTQEALRGMLAPQGSAIVTPTSTATPSTAELRPAPLASMPTASYDKLVARTVEDLTRRNTHDQA